MLKTPKTVAPFSREILDQALAEHCSRNKRRAETAISAASARWLWTWCDEHQPRKILDVGSGFSTLVLRSWAHLNGALVWTTDEHLRWLNTTKIETGWLGLDTKRFWTQAEFDPLVYGKFDLVFLDSGPIAARTAFASRCAAWCAPDGAVVMDDWQRTDYAEAMSLEMERHGFLVMTLESRTTDLFGRFMAVATRNGVDSHTPMLREKRGEAPLSPTHSV